MVSSPAAFSYFPVLRKLMRSWTHQQCTTLSSGYFYEKRKHFSRHTNSELLSQHFHHTSLTIMGKRPSKFENEISVFFPLLRFSNARDPSSHNCSCYQWFVRHLRAKLEFMKPLISFIVDRYFTAHE